MGCCSFTLWCKSPTCHLNVFMDRKKEQFLTSQKRPFIMNLNYCLVQLLFLGYYLSIEKINLIYLKFWDTQLLKCLNACPIWTVQGSL